MKDAKGRTAISGSMKAARWMMRRSEPQQLAPTAFRNPACWIDELKILYVGDISEKSGRIVEHNNVDAKPHKLWHDERTNDAAPPVTSSTHELPFPPKVANRSTTWMIECKIW